MKTGIELISDERQRQIEKEGYSHKHDDEHTGGELAFNAALYATPFNLYEMEEFANTIRFNVAKSDWGLKLNYNGNIIMDNCLLSKNKRIDQLVKAGALIIAEIERLQRLTPAQEAEKI